MHAKYILKLDFLELFHTNVIGAYVCSTIIDQPALKSQLLWQGTARQYFLVRF